MLRQWRLVCCVALLAPVAAGVVAQQPAYESKPVTRTATIVALDKANRAVTLKGSNGESFEIQAPDQMEGFDRLKVGDQVSATYFEAVAIHVRRSGDPAPLTDPATTITRKDRMPGSERRRQQTVTGTLEAIDLKTPSVRVRGARGQVLTLAVSDPQQLQVLKVGDAVDLTYYQSLLVEVAHPKK